MIALETMKSFKNLPLKDPEKAAQEARVLMTMINFQRLVRVIKRNRRRICEKDQRSIEEIVPVHYRQRNDAGVCHCNCWSSLKLNLE